MFDTNQNYASLSPSSSGQEFTQIYIASVTGQKWAEIICEDETVQTLKDKIWRRCGVLPYHQGLIYGEKSLSNGDGRVLLKELGIHPNSLIRLVIVTRSGPLAIPHTEHHEEDVEIDVNKHSFPETCWNEKKEFDESFLEENRRTLFKMCELRRQMHSENTLKSKSLQDEESRTSAVSAPEDTSAKESSAGETEIDDETTRFSSNIQMFKNATTLIPVNGRLSCKKGRHTMSIKTETYEEQCISNVRNNTLSAKSRLLFLMHSRPESPVADVNALSEDGSEFSSGMIICDLTNEFRKLKVRRRHHPANSNNTTTKTYLRSKSKGQTFMPTHKDSDVTSSDDELPSLRQTLDICVSSRSGPSCPSLRKSTAVPRAQKLVSGYQSQHRCYTCASKLSSCSIPFHCRCGKRLCARHRHSDMHACSRLRKMQDVSD
uniref:Ubiquitin-like domain-containing protein n=1 Tax=Syphacia muris TaxID=451379 RepID=A0A0N5AUM1_9BILA